MTEPAPSRTNQPPASMPPPTPPPPASSHPADPLCPTCGDQELPIGTYCPGGAAVQQALASWASYGERVRTYQRLWPKVGVPAAWAGWELATWPFERGILSGYASGIFRPAAYTTRGEFAKIAVNAFGVPAYTPTSGQSFSDIPRSHPFFRYVEAAAHANVIQGLGNSSFSINRNITRADATLIVVHTRGYALLNPTIPTLSDVPRDFYAYQAIETLAARGIINGSSGGGFIFRPADPITRGELAKVTRRAIESPP